MGRKSAQKSVRRAKKEARKNAELDASMGIPSFAELEAELEQKEKTGGRSGASGLSSSASGSSRRAGPSNKYKYDELKQLVESGEDEFGFRCFCNHVLSTEDVHESIVDDPQFRDLYRHMNRTIRAKTLMGLDDEQYLVLAKSTNTTGTDPDEIIERYIQKKKDLQAAGRK